MTKRILQLQKQFHSIFIHSVWQIMWWKIAIGPFFLSRLTLTSIRVSRIYIEINYSFFHEVVHKYYYFPRVSRGWQGSNCYCHGHSPIHTATGPANRISVVGDNRLTPASILLSHPYLACVNNWLPVKWILIFLIINSELCWYLGFFVETFFI